MTEPVAPTPPSLAEPPPHPAGKPWRLAYLGTPDMAVPPLRAVVAAGHEVVLVVSRADARRERGSARQPSPVKAAALELGLPVTDRVADVVGTGAELGVVVAFGRLIRRPVLEAMAFVNIHFSLLPRWRGAAPVERALLAGDRETGVCVMRLEEALDTGPVYASQPIPIGRRATASGLRAELVDAGTALLLDQLARGLDRPRPQVGEPTYAAKIEPDELRLDWTKPADELDRLVRLGTAWTTFRGRRLRVLDAQPAPMPPQARPAGALDGRVVACGDGALELLVVQPESKGPMDAAAWARGAHPDPQERLGG